MAVCGSSIIDIYIYNNKNYPVNISSIGSNLDLYRDISYISGLLPILAGLFLRKSQDFYRTWLYIWVTHWVSYNDFCIKNYVRFIFASSCFIAGLMSCLRYWCLFVYSGVHHILRCVFVLFVFVLCTPCCQFLWIVQFWLLFRCSLTRLFNLITRIFIWKMTESG